MFEETGVGSALGDQRGPDAAVDADRADRAVGATTDAVDISGMSADECLEVLRDRQRVIAAAEADMHQALARLDEIRGVTADDWTREEVAAALSVSPPTAGPGWRPPAPSITGLARRGGCCVPGR